MLSEYSHILILEKCAVHATWNAELNTELEMQFILLSIQSLKKNKVILLAFAAKTLLLLQDSEGWTLIGQNLQLAKNHSSQMSCIEQLPISHWDYHP